MIRKPKKPTRVFQPSAVETSSDGGTRSSSLQPSTAGGIFNHELWPVKPTEEQTEFWYLSASHKIETEARPATVRRFAQDWYEHFSQKKGDSLAVWWLKAKTVYWLQRCRCESRGIPLSDAFWKSYDAVMGDRVCGLDPIYRFVLNEERAMAEKKAQVVPQKKALPAKKVQAQQQPMKKAIPARKVAAAPAQPAKPAITKKSIQPKPQSQQAGKKERRRGLIAYAITVLSKSKSALSAKEIVDKALASGYQCNGVTPWATLSASIYRAIKAGDTRWRNEEGRFSYNPDAGE